jgi:hypothetical protein
MLRKRKSYLPFALGGAAAVFITCGGLLAIVANLNDKKASKAKGPAINMTIAGSEEDAVQYVIFGSSNEAITTLKDNQKLPLPAVLNVPTKTKSIQFQFRRDGKPVGVGNIICTLSSLATETEAVEFLQTKAMSLTINNEDLQLASQGPVYTFVYLPYQGAAKKQLADAGVVQRAGLLNAAEYTEALKKLREKGILLGELKMATH